ncbi:hypothetical protein JVT61DRAFT_12237 [Boletus reticuloceps]|uniref:STAG domain-containing protein n=1 Tax=Boletus reticuloceps TaxID=495285 RepID=A0A8I2YE35_9AGAM|nr:hypothetical protein JVT61DRAFT_12237 [Boletus reticuloceps]
MSSSQIRCFRHTATVVALEIENTLCQVAAVVEKESANANASHHKSGKDLDGKAAEVRERRTILAEYLKEIVDG